MLRDRIYAPSWKYVIYTYIEISNDLERCLEFYHNLRGSNANNLFTPPSLIFPSQLLYLLSRKAISSISLTMAARHSVRLYAVLSITSALPYTLREKLL